MWKCFRKEPNNNIPQCSCVVDYLFLFCYDDMITSSKFIEHPKTCRGSLVTPGNIICICYSMDTSYSYSGFNF